MDFHNDCGGIWESLELQKVKDVGASKGQRHFVTIKALFITFDKINFKALIGL